jgi:hypothetical protein
VAEAIDIIARKRKKVFINSTAEKMLEIFLGICLLRETYLTAETLKPKFITIIP